MSGCWRSGSTVPSRVSISSSFAEIRLGETGSFESQQGLKFAQLRHLFAGRFEWATAWILICRLALSLRPRPLTGLVPSPGAQGGEAFSPPAGISAESSNVLMRTLIVPGLARLSFVGFRGKGCRWSMGPARAHSVAHSEELGRKRNPTLSQCAAEVLGIGSLEVPEERLRLHPLSAVSPAGGLRDARLGAKIQRQERMTTLPTLRSKRARARR